MFDFLNWTPEPSNYVDASSGNGDITAVYKYDTPEPTQSTSITTSYGQSGGFLEAFTSSADALSKLVTGVSNSVGSVVKAFNDADNVYAGAGGKASPPPTIVQPAQQMNPIVQAAIVAVGVLIIKKLFFK